MLRVLGALAVALTLLVAMELGLRLLPIAKGVHRQNPQSADSSTRLLAHHDYTFSLGWDLRHVVHGHTNDMGFISPHEYTASRPAVALLGDSFVEGEMLSYEESLAGHLDAALGGRAQAFNFGMSGAAMPHYLGIAREMAERFRFTGAVVVITGDDYIEGFQRQEGLYAWSKDPRGALIELVPAARRSRFVQLARESALANYLRLNLKFSPSRLLAFTGHPACSRGELTEDDRIRLARYVDALPQALHLPPQRIVLVFTEDVGNIYERVDRKQPASLQRKCMDRDALARAELERLAAARGMQRIDAGSVLEKHYRAHHWLLDFSPVDKHWNGTSTAALAAEIAPLLGAGSEAPRPNARAVTFAATKSDSVSR